MGLSLRAYFIDKEDKIKRIPFSRFVRIRARDPKERLPEYRDTLLRYLVVTVELENRKPVSIKELSCRYLKFDSNGYADEEFRRAQGQLEMDMFFSSYSPNESEKVINAGNKFARKRLEHEFAWTPSLELQAAIIEKIFEFRPKPTASRSRPGKVLLFRREIK